MLYIMIRRSGQNLRNSTLTDSLLKRRPNIVSYDWMPFGAGPRNCIAIRLALLEVKVAVAHLVQKYNFVRSVDTEVSNSILYLNNAPVG